MKRESKISEKNLANIVLKRRKILRKIAMDLRQVE